MVSGDARDHRDQDEQHKNSATDQECLYPSRRACLVAGWVTERRSVCLCERIRHAFSPLCADAFLRDTVSLSIRDGACATAYPRDVPKLWTDTVESHRAEVRAAILESAARLVAERGPLGVTMSEIAERSGIGRATLYKYFADVEAVLAAWHERHVHEHLSALAATARRPGAPGDRLQAVLERYALMVFERHRSDLAALLHRADHVAEAHSQLHEFVRSLVVEGGRAGDVRDDVPPDELTSFCLQALGAAQTLTSKAAVRRLVAVTVAGLQPQRRNRQGRPREH